MFIKLLTNNELEGCGSGQGLTEGSVLTFA